MEKNLSLKQLYYSCLLLVMLRAFRAFGVKYWLLNMLPLRSFGVFKRASQLFSRIAFRVGDSASPALANSSHKDDKRLLSNAKAGRFKREFVYTNDSSYICWMARVGASWLSPFATRPLIISII
jgi:hypothetical protein